MTGVEKYSYLKRIIKNLNFSSESQIEVNTRHEVVKVGNDFVFLTMVMAKTDIDNFKYMVVGDGIKKQIFDNYSDYIKFVNNIERTGDIIK